MKFKEGKMIEKFFVEKKGEKIPVTIRYLKKNDAANLAKLFNELVREGAFLNRNKKITLSEQRKRTNEHIENARKNKGVSLLVQSNKNIIGSAGGTRGEGAHAHTVDIGIAMSKEFRGLGVGEKLMKILIQLSKENFGSEIMELKCYDQNRTALNLYRKLGFKEVGRIKKGLKLKRKYFNEVIMVKNL